MIPWMCPQGAQVELQRERFFSKFLTLSSEVSECKALEPGSHAVHITATGKTEGPTAGPYIWSGYHTGHIYVWSGDHTGHISGPGLHLVRGPYGPRQRLVRRPCDVRPCPTGVEMEALTAAAVAGLTARAYTPPLFGST